MKEKGEPEGMVTIPKRVYERLIEVDKWYEHLQGCGIDNSSAYQYACETYEGEDDDERE